MISFNRIKTLATRAADDSKLHGYKDADKPVERTLAKAAIEMAEAVNAFRDKRFVPHKIYLDHMNYILPDQKEWVKKRYYKKIYEQYAKDTVQDELADVAIYCLVAAGNLGDKFAEPFRAENKDLIRYIEETDFIDFSGFIMSMLTGAYTVPKLFDSISLAILSVIDHIDKWMEHHLNQSLEYWIEQKMQFNKHRPVLHGRKDDPTI